MFDGERSGSKKTSLQEVESQIYGIVIKEKLRVKCTARQITEEDFKLICSKLFKIIDSDLVMATNNDIKLTL